MRDPKRLTVGDVVQKSADWLRGRGIEDSPRLDAELLLARILRCDRLRLYMDWQKPLTELELSAYRDFIRRRGQEREPVSHILGVRSFFGREMEVTADTFAPRPETEGLVERALALLETDPTLAAGRQNIFEIGTGTGVIIITLAAESDGHRYLASELLPAAHAVARRNAHRHGVDGRIDLRQGEYFAGFEGTLDLVISNPPYIPSDRIASLPPEVRDFDPREALDGGAAGMEAINVIAAGSARRLRHGGWLLLEIGEEQGPACRALLNPDAGWAACRVEKDLAGHDRYVLAQRA